MSDDGNGEAIRDWHGRFLPGHHFHRPKGARNILGQEFIDDIYRDWIQNGPEVLRQVRETRPADYLKVVALIVSRCDDSVFTAVARDQEMVQLIEERRQAAVLEIAKLRETDNGN
jgi:hypothetical protein